MRVPGSVPLASCSRALQVSASLKKLWGGQGTIGTLGGAAVLPAVLAELLFILPPLCLGGECHMNAAVILCALTVNNGISFVFVIGALNEHVLHNRSFRHVRSLPVKISRLGFLVHLVPLFLSMPSFSDSLSLHRAFV